MAPAKSLIYGGCYKEVCVTPHHDQLMGSGFRASLVLANLTPEIKHTWLTWLSDADHVHVEGAISSNINIDLVELASTKRALRTPRFQYLNPLAPPSLELDRPTYHSTSPKRIAESALVFGTLENRPTICADKVVYDPQNPDKPDHFFDNGSFAPKCALVLNHREVTKLACNNDIDSALKLLKSFLLAGSNPPYEVIVVKMAHV